MILREVEVKKPDGVQRYDAQVIVQRAMRYTSSILFEWRTGKVNAKSLMGVLSMALKCGDKLMVLVNGEDQDDAMREIVDLFEYSFKL